MELWKYGLGGVLALSLVVEIAPIKINPWRWLLKKIGNALNAGAREEIAGVKQQLQKLQEDLTEHKQVDDARNADAKRAAILQFNTELLRGISHTREDFIEVLAIIDEYEAYCRTHAEYKNSRSVHAIANIGRVYDDRLRKRDFLGEGDYAGDGAK